MKKTTKYELGIFKQTSSKGTVYYSGSGRIDEKHIKVMLFKNEKHAENTKLPAYNVIVQLEEIDARSASKQASKGDIQETPGPEAINGDPIPF